MSAARFALAIALAALIAPSIANATQVMHLDTRGLTRESSDIVIGTVGEQQAHWNDAHTMIVTEVTIHVSQSLKGVATPDLQLTQIGGEVDGMRYSVPGSPSFRTGEEVLIFAWRDRTGRPQVDGLSQGKFEIQRDPASGARVVQRAAPGLGIRDAKSLEAVPTGRRAPRLKLDTLVREIQGALQEDGR
jgi:hypothetical protein